MHKYAKLTVFVIAVLIITVKHAQSYDYTNTVIGTLSFDKNSVTQHNNYSYTQRDNCYSINGNNEYNNVYTYNFGWSGYNNQQFAIHRDTHEVNNESVSKIDSSCPDRQPNNYDTTSQNDGHLNFLPINLKDTSYSIAYSNGSTTGSEKTDTAYSYKIGYCRENLKVKNFYLHSSMPNVKLFDNSNNVIYDGSDVNQVSNLTINGVSPNIDTINNRATWIIPSNNICGDNITFTPSFSGSNYWVNANVYEFSANMCPAITGFSANWNETGDTIINPVIGGNVRFYASTGVDAKWTLTVAGRKFQGVGGVDVIWDAKTSDGKVVNEGVYYAKLQIDDEKCADTKELKITVKRTEDCQLQVTFGSSANLGSGNLSDQQQLFSLKGGSISTDISLYYNSLEARNGTLDSSINSYYQKTLVDNGNGTIDFIESDRTRTYTLNTSSGIANIFQAADMSTIIKNADGTYKLTEVYGSKSTFNTDGTIDSMVSDVFKYNVTYSEGKASGITLWYHPFPNLWEGHTVNIASSFAFNSFNPFMTSLGGGWSHSYEAALQDQGDGSILFRSGNMTRHYVPSGSGYISQNGDKSTLVKNADGTYVISETNGRKGNFDVTGKIVSRADRNGNTFTFAYAGGNLTSVTDSLGRTTTFSYDSSNKLSTITDPNGNPYTFTYDGNNLIAITNPDGGHWSYTYDTAGFLLTKTDPNGYTTTYNYDDSHRILSSQDPEGKVRNLSSSLNSYGTMFTEKDGGVWRNYISDSVGKLGMKIDPLGNDTRFDYDANGNMLSKTEPGNRTTTYGYDALDRVISVTDPLVNTTSYTYNDFDQILTTTNPRGTITNTYDANANLTSTTDFAGATTTYEYDAKGHVTKITNAKGQEATLAYGASGNLTSITDLLGTTTSFTYDTNGNVLSQTVAGKTTTFEYDNRNRLTKTTDPLGNITSYTYDPMGNRISTTDANGNTTTYKYNYQGQVTEVKDALGKVTSFAYTSTGCTSCGGGVDKLASLTDAKMQTTNYQYDLLGRLTAETDSLANATSYGYDPVGNVTLKRDANTASVVYTYDALKRLTGKRYPDNTTESYSYDTLGNPATVGNKNISYTYTYDAAGRVTNVTDSRGYSVSYEYDILGNRTKTTLMPGTPDERVVTYAYDNGNRLTGITSNAGSFTLGYDTLGRRTSLAYPNQVTTSYVYDDASRLTSLTHQAAGATIASFSYTNDKAGNRMSRTGTETQNYLYDLIYRLLTVSAANPESFTYDAVGNRQAGPGAKDTGYLYDAGNQMTQGRKLQYLYDANGNQTNRIVPGEPDMSWWLTWDYENRLTEVDKYIGNDGRTITFKYDPYGRRIEKSVITNIDSNTKTETFSYIYDNEDIIMEVYKKEEGGQTTSEITRYTHGPGIDEPLALERNGQYYYFHADGLGSVVDITDASRAVVQSYEYDSFGMVKPATSFRNSYTYTGREWDKETGLYYYRARYYDPMEGRFTAKDPIGFAGGDMVLYGYVQNNPVNEKDPFGLTPLDPATGKPNPNLNCHVCSHDDPRENLKCALGAGTIVGGVVGGVFVAGSPEAQAFLSGRAYSSGSKGAMPILGTAIAEAIAIANEMKKNKAVSDEFYRQEYNCLCQ